MSYQSQQVISYADLSVINNALRSISSEMTGVHSELGTINVKQGQLENELLKLAHAFADFVLVDTKQKSLQFAETRQGNLKQDLQIKFGYYAEVRRMATGILQAVDTGVVSDETLHFTTEEVMIKAPGYWLAPSLVALASWIRNDRTNTEKALNESLKRDDYKTTLFFMLVMRRLTRNEASHVWLERYFMHQNPHNLDREVIVILEAITTGIFPPASRQLMLNHVRNWLELLSKDDRYINAVKIQWVKFFEAMGPVQNGKYPLLEKFAQNWPSLEKSIKECKTHAVLHSHFQDIVSSSSDFSKAIKVQLDEILSMLVTNFDDEELPLQQQIRLNQLIIQMNGDKDAAQKLMDTEKHIFDESVNFLQLLTNAAFNPEQAGVSKVTQALAVSISQPWIVEAHDTFTASSRYKIPAAVELNIDGFTASSPNGSDEKDHVQAHDFYWSNVLSNELKKVAVPFSRILTGGFIMLLGIWGFNIHWIVGIAGLGIGGVMIWNAVDKFRKAKQSVRANVEERRINSREILRGCIAEIVDYRKEATEEDAKAEELRQLLTSITPENFSSVSKDTKNILQTN